MIIISSHIFRDIYAIHNVFSVTYASILWKTFELVLPIAIILYNINNIVMLLNAFVFYDFCRHITVTNNKYENCFTNN